MSFLADVPMYRGTSVLGVPILQTEADVTIHVSLAAKIIIAVILIPLLYFLYFRPPVVKLLEYNPNATPFKEYAISQEMGDILLSIMSRTSELLATQNIDYFMIAGTLLGSERYENRMPWDDDIDIAIFDENVKKFESIIFKSKGLGVRRTFYGYKIFDLELSHPLKNEWEYPFVDVFRMTKSGNDVHYSNIFARIWWHKEALKMNEIYPLTRRKFANLMLPAPNKSEQYLDRAYPGWRTEAVIDSTHVGQKQWRVYKLPINNHTTSQIKQNM